MNIRKINEELEKFILNELSDATKQRAVDERTARYLAAQATADREKAKLDKLKKIKRNLEPKQKADIISSLETIVKEASFIGTDFSDVKEENGNFIIVISDVDLDNGKLTKSAEERLKQLLEEMSEKYGCKYTYKVKGTKIEIICEKPKIDDMKLPDGTWNIKNPTIKKIYDYLGYLEDDLFEGTYTDGKTAVYLDYTDSGIHADYLLRIESNDKDITYQQAVSYLKSKMKIYDKFHYISNGVEVGDATCFDTIEDIDEEDYHMWTSFITVTIYPNEFDGNLEYIKERLDEYCTQLKKAYDKIKSKSFKKNISKYDFILSILVSEDIPNEDVDLLKILNNQGCVNDQLNSLYNEGLGFDSGLEVVRTSEFDKSKLASDKKYYGVKIVPFEQAKCFLGYATDDPNNRTIALGVDGFLFDYSFSGINDIEFYVKNFYKDYMDDEDFKGLSEKAVIKKLIDKLNNMNSEERVKDVIAHSPDWYQIYCVTYPEQIN